MLLLYIFFLYRLLEQIPPPLSRDKEPQKIKFIGYQWGLTPLLLLDDLDKILIHHIYVKSRIFSPSKSHMILEKLKFRVFASTY